MRMLLRRSLAMALILLFILGINFLGGLLMPVRANFGSNWENYTQEPKNSIDVLFLGSSMAYCNVNPAVIYRQSGLTSYVVAGPELSMPITYYYLREALRTQSPQAVCLEVNALFFGKTTGFTKVTVGYMPWSWNRLQATFCAAEPELWFGLLFPIYFYHECYQTIGISTIQQHLFPEPDPFAGYTLLQDKTPQTGITERAYHADTESYRENMRYIQKIAKLCQKQGIQLYLYASPSKAVIPENAMETMLCDFAELGVSFYDFNQSLPQMAIDDGQDWYDALHFNLHGAVKFSSFLADFLTQQNIVTQQLPELSPLWSQRVATLQAELDALEAADTAA